MGAIGLNGASQAVSTPEDRITVASAGWARWAPVQAVGLGAHLLGGLVVLVANRDRAATQDDVRTNTNTKLVLTLAAAAATVWSGVLGAELARDGAVPAATGVIPVDETPPGVRAAQQQLRALQWVIPSLTGVVLALDSQEGEQQARDTASPPARAAAGARRSARRAR